MVQALRILYSTPVNTAIEYIAELARIFHGTNPIILLFFIPLAMVIFVGGIAAIFAKDTSKFIKAIVLIIVVVVFLYIIYNFLEGPTTRLLNLANFNRHLFTHKSCQCRVRPTHQSLLDQCSKVA